MERTYIAIDLKSFYASVECVERGLDPLTTNLVVADASRTEKTICLAVSPSLKAYGIPGRARLFEVVQKVKEVNEQRLKKARHYRFHGSSTDAKQLEADSALSLDYITAVPQMALYMQYSTKIYQIYLKYVDPNDIHVYSIDEVFMDVTSYLHTYKMTPYELAMCMIQDVLKNTGITATAGIAENLYLCKVAMDIVAKHVPADADGVRIATLDTLQYRKLLWTHRPLTSFWRVGRGIAKKLEENGMYTMGDVARCSLGGSTDFYNEDLLYRLFGVNAELLIDHAWGYEPCTMKEIRAYTPATKSIGTGQVLHCAYSSEKAKLIVREMTDLLVLDLVDQNLVCDAVVLTIGYDISNLSDTDLSTSYTGEVTTDYFGRSIPKHSHGTARLKFPTSSTKLIMDAMMKLYDRIVNPGLWIRRINITCEHVEDRETAEKRGHTEQLSLFDAPRTDRNEDEREKETLAKERRAQEAMLKIKKKYGKNAILKGMNFEEGATTIQRNEQIGGHRK